jgi:LPS O-antigen subunit length determinant protein (WzzB/FepE family)
MNRLAKWMMRLYPAAWRARYGDEMDALLADSGADAKTVADLLTGGMRMRFSKGSFLKLAVALGVAGLLMGLGASYLLKPQYVSKATLEMTAAPPVTAQDPTDQLSRMIQLEYAQVTSRSTLSRIINDLALYNDERRSTPLENVMDEMRASTLIQFKALPGRHASAFNIRFTYPDKLKAQQTVNALMNAFEEQNQEMQRGEQYRLHGYVLEVLEVPTLPVTSASPNRYQYASLGCLLGFLLAFAITVVRGGGHSPSAPMLATNE